MNFRISPPGPLAVLLAALSLVSFNRVPRAGASITSGGAVGVALVEPREREERLDVLRLIAEHSSGTYIGEMLLQRDSALARWRDRGAPLTVWIQSAPGIPEWSESYAEDVRDAFRKWDALRLPVRFAFIADSAHADVHVTFVDEFDEEVSGRTRWVRDEDWWITSADIALAVHHRGGPVLDNVAMKAMTLHEIGHLLGLDHTGDPKSIMASKVRVRSLSNADRATARLLYTLPAGGVR